MSAELLRRAASAVREAASAAELSAHTYWPDLWQVEACVNDRTNDCPCIVSQGEDWRGAVQCIADAETPAYANWIAMMSTHLAEPFAAMLEEQAKAIDATHAAAEHVWPEPGEENERAKAKFLDEAMTKFANFFALARVILKEEES